MRESERKGQHRKSVPGGGNSTAQALRRHDVPQELKEGQCGQDLDRRGSMVRAG